jgi:alkanesulfonate monooxygenase SsuD/methylene tetrahydromethanopterin reductase-like flavin-dependent oxidoreductase (luciferase family)
VEPLEVAQQLADELQRLFPDRRSSVALLGAEGPLSVLGDAPDEYAQTSLEETSSLTNAALEGKAVGMMSGYPLAGSAEGIIDLFTDLFENGELDGVVLTVPDFIDDLEFLGEKVMPVMKARGFTRQISTAPALVS